MSRAVHIVATGTANLASVQAAFARLGVATVLTTDPAVVERADRVVLPGVGALGAAMANLHAANLVEPLRQRIRSDRATLAICLGLQVLLDGSEESPGVAGLGVVPGTARRFQTAMPVPQLGWNRVLPGVGCTLIGAGFAYYANSFRLESAPSPSSGWRTAWTDYAGPFVAALQRGNVLACQFHPELSGPWGAALLKAWLDRAGEPPTTAESLTLTPTTALRPSIALPPRVIPCLDVRDGRVVKGVRFQNLRDAGDPRSLAAAYEEQGADELVMLDVSATSEGRRAKLATIDAVRRAISIPLTVGGGVRSDDDAAAMLDAGADKVGVNSAAVDDPALLTRLADRFGSQCVVLAIDAARAATGRWEVVVRSGTVRTGLDVVEWARRATAAGAGEILLTSYDRDGTHSGYDLEQLRAVKQAVSVPVIASGGAANAAHLHEALLAGADAVLAASIFHDGAYTVDRIKAELSGLGVAMRPPWKFAAGALAQAGTLS